MFDWISFVWAWGQQHIGGPIVDWVRDLIHGVWSFLTTIFGNVGEAWHDMWVEANKLWDAASRFGKATWGSIWHILFVVIPHVVHWAWRELMKLGHLIADVRDWAIREFLKFLHWVLALLSSLEHWVITHIWDPLDRAITLAWRWIAHEGTIVWYYITHPAKLVDILWQPLLAAIESNAWSAGSALGGFFLALVVHNVKRFVLLLEDIVMAVF
jgi:hypothetical protein